MNPGWNFSTMTNRQRAARTVALGKLIASTWSDADVSLVNDFVLAPADTKEEMARHIAALFIMKCSSDAQGMRLFIKTK